MRFSPLPSRTFLAVVAPLLAITSLLCHRVSAWAVLALRFPASGCGSASPTPVTIAALWHRSDVAAAFAAWAAGALFCAATPAVAAITWVDSSTTAGSSAVSSIAVTKPAGLTTGDLMLAYVATRGGGQFPAPISAPPGWSAVLTDDDGSSIGVAIFRKVATAAEPASYSFALGASDRTAASIVVFRGVDGTNPVNASGSQVNAASTTYTAPSITSNSANTMLVTFHGAVNGNGTVATSTGMTQAYSAGTSAGNNGVVIGSSYAPQAAAGASGTKVSSGNTALVNMGALVALVALQAAPVSPLAYWRMDEAQWNGSANEVLDSSGNAYHGRAQRAAGATALPTAVSGTPAYSSGGQSTCNAGQFDSSTGTVRTYGYVELALLPNLATTSPWQPGCVPTMWPPSANASWSRTTPTTAGASAWATVAAADCACSTATSPTAVPSQAAG